MLLELLSHREADVVVPEGAYRLRLKLVSVLDDHFGLMQVGGDLPGGEVDVCEGQSGAGIRVSVEAF